METYNIKDKMEYLKEVCKLTEREWGKYNDEKEFNEKVNKKIEKVKQLINTDDYCKLILLDGDKLVGFVSIFPNDCAEKENLTPWYSTMYVKEEYRGKGYSKLLNEAILKMARKMGYSKIYLKTNLNNYYEKFGAIYMETLKNGEKLYCIPLREIMLENSKDLTIDVNDYILNVRAGAIIIHNGKVLLHKNANSDHYCIIGGRVQIGEDSNTTAKREVEEELGKKIETKRFIATIENFFKDGSEFEDNIKAYKFMKNNSIYDLILSKLNKKEIEEANTKIKKYSDLDEENLNEKINSLSDKDFNNLSMVDSYVLHALSDVEFERNSEEAENRLAYYERQYCGITGDKSDGRKVI